jgi:hypothetical protein
MAEDVTNKHTLRESPRWHGLHRTEWFHLLLLLILPIFAIQLLWNLSYPSNSRGLFFFEVSLFFFVGIIIEIEAAALWLHNDTVSAKISALLAGIFLSGIIGVGLFFLVQPYLFVFFAILILPIAFVIAILIGLWQGYKAARAKALETLAGREVKKWTWIGGAATLVYCGIFSLGYSYLRPEITTIPLPKQVAELSISDWEIQSSVGPLIKQGAFETSKTTQIFTLIRG